MADLREDIINEIKKVYDPEIPVNIWDLGLIYDIAINKDSVVIEMTFTSPTCPMMEDILNQQPGFIKADWCGKKECEDEKHMAETFKTIVVNKISIPQIKLYFSTDLRQNEETLAKTLVEFKQDPETKKYKMVDVEVKLLGI